MEAVDLGLYDSDTGASLEALHVADVSEFQSNYQRARLIYTEAKAGSIVQLRRGDEHGGDARIHYFYREPGGQQMIEEDTRRFGFQPGELLSLVIRHAPSPVDA